MPPLVERPVASRGEWFVRILTTIHALGSVVLLCMTIYVLMGSDHAEALARTPGARLMVTVLGALLPMCLGALAAFLGAMALASHHRRPWAWRAAVISYSVGVLGGLWEVSIGIHQAWLSTFINAIVVTLLLTGATRRVYFQSVTKATHDHSPILRGSRR